MVPLTLEVKRNAQSTDRCRKKPSRFRVAESSAENQEPIILTDWRVAPEICSYFLGKPGANNSQLTPLI
jgi:hypothetical protein